MTTYPRREMTPLCIGLCCLAVFFFDMPVLPAQTAPTQLNIVVVEGEGATNGIGQRVNHAPVIRVEDQNHKPLNGAVVVFMLPTDGATGEFARGSKTLTVMTDGRGEAAALDLRTNRVPGDLPIHVSVSYRGLTARTTITQFTVAPPGARTDSGVAGHGSSGKWIAVLAVIGAAAGGGAYAALHKGGTTAPTTATTTAATVTITLTPIGLTPGTGTITGPH